MKANKKRNRKKYILIGASVGTLGLLGFGYWYFIGRKGTNINDERLDVLRKLTSKKTTPEKQEPDTEENSIPALPPAKSTGGNTKQSSFPLKEHSKGALVKQLQLALIKRYGKDILPVHGADGGFGKETVDALTSKGFPTSIDKETFDKITAGTPSGKPTAEPKATLTTKQAVDVVKNIWFACTTKKLDVLVTQLKRVQNSADYTIANALFKTIRTDGVRQTIVNAALSTFEDATAKQMISGQLERIGLKYDGEKWALSGFYPKQLITNRHTTIRSLEGIELEIPGETLLGERISERSGFTKFRTVDGQVLLVPTEHINIL